ncbi:MAG: hypothetical protein E3J87_06165 [Candidatus Cloacimonadota bacterium]|nr:MAG: hypothetical protein E3J87_06165 [Candidatus Cloacimonadota bacterium]
MKKVKIALFILLIMLIALPLFGQRRGRRSRKAKTAPLTIGIYGGMEDLGDTTRFFSFGGEAILPVINPVMFRVSFLRFDMPEAGNTINFGTGFFGGDIMYYWQVPMTFIPYGFGGLHYYSYSNETSTSNITLHAGVGGQMPGLYNFFLEGGIDYLKLGDLDADTPFFVHGGLRFPLFR